MMKKYIVYLLLILCSACSTTEYVEIPVDRVKIEYREKTSIDTIIRNDSIIIKQAGDTVLIEKYKYLYKVKEVRDTINNTDTVTVVKVVEVPVKERYTPFLLKLAAGMGFAALLWIVYKIINKIKLWWI